MAAAFEWVDSGVLAGLSITLCAWLIFGTLGMGALTWRHRDRFGMSIRPRADELLTLGLFGYLAHGALHRGIATYGFATQTWSATAATPAVTTLNLIEALAAVACILWWMCIEIFGPHRNRVWWAVLMVSGGLLGIGVSWKY